MSQTVEYVVKVNGAQQGAAQVAIVENSLKKTEHAAMQAGAAMDKAVAPTRNFGHGMMQAAAFADDLQYGLKGVVNNIPGVLTGFGVGMGVAGAVQIAAVAVNQLTSKLTAYIKRQQEATQEAIKFRLTQQDQRIAALSATLSLEEQFDLLQKMKGATSEYGRTQIEIATTINKQITDVNERRRNAEEEIDRLTELGRSRVDKRIGSRLGRDALALTTLTQGEKNRLLSMQEAVKTAALETEQLAQQGMLKSEIARLSKEIAEDDAKRLKGKKSLTKAKREELELELEHKRLMDEQAKQIRRENDEIVRQDMEERNRASKMLAERDAEDRKALEAKLDMDRRIRLMADEMELADIERHQAAVMSAKMSFVDDMQGLAANSVGIVADATNQMVVDMITGQEHALENFAISVMAQAGQSLIASGVKLGGEAVFSAFTPGMQPVALAQAGAAAGLIATGIGLGGSAAALGNALPVAGSGASQAARDPGASPRGSGASSGGGGPMIINVAYGAGGPLPEDIAREIGRVVRSGDRRRGAS